MAPFGELKLNNSINIPSGMGECWGSAGESFLNGILNKGNVFDCAATAIEQGSSAMLQQLFQQTIGDALSGFDLGGILKSISTSKEKAKNEKVKNEYDNNVEAADRTVTEGVQEAETLIQEADGKINGYNKELNELAKLLEEATEVSKSLPEEMSKKIQEQRDKIAEYEKVQIERYAIEKQLDSATTDREKAKLQKKYNKLTTKLGELSTGINAIQTEIGTIKATLDGIIANAQKDQETALGLQEQAVVVSEEINESANTIIENTSSSAQGFLANANNNSHILSVYANNQKATGERMLAMGAAKTFLSFGAGAGSLNTARELITIGADAFGLATNLQANLPGVIAGLGQKLTNIDPTTFNNSLNSFGINLETYNNNLVTFVENLQANTTIYDFNNEEKKEEKQA